ncbi:MAG: hypothetical protein OXT72_03270 [Gammaproteobacteria bacterium]|nr:hypothetical protein [Gammaproteobacteria bacterium]MDE0249279.1 hypothetical protein [Gammaproteobacteria bacterium]
MRGRLFTIALVLVGGCGGDPPSPVAPTTVTIRDTVVVTIVSPPDTVIVFPVPAPRPTTGTVRVIYAIPTDRTFNPVFRDSIQSAIENVQRWYQTQLSGRTFRLYGDAPETCELPYPEAFYNAENKSWSQLLNHGLRDCAPVRTGREAHLFVIYADVDEDCTQGYSLGRGWNGLTQLGRWDLIGLTNRTFVQCGWSSAQPLGRWHGGLAHELTHTFNIPHPPGCNERLPICPRSALMDAGYVRYPDTYLLDYEKEILLASPFIIP